MFTQFEVGCQRLVHSCETSSRSPRFEKRAVTNLVVF